ncbi:VacB/RNase II family 3'-5' exoribonuclease [Reinekea marina]|uniref:exoribonuclease II n=1 Tax=Reinekea marina TaxID=1310421 RepID=A0ABV7WS78_9GAMM|nr:VacB/RNase II family 3'-5' exoribonuclease [Reinekea marina]MDN3650443.1 VacB/RNase II family 3'-5' exoribonuclease [Reinekea marina]
MLDLKSLDVLNALKTEIQANKETFTGTVKGTGKSFGFVVAEDGTETFLAPDEMSKVFPGDKVTFIIEEQADNKTKAILESLVNSDLKEFMGTFVVRGKAQGVEPMQSNFSGWLFVPPSHVNEAKSKQIVKAQVTRHPWETGKAQAKVLETIGDANDNRTWYAMSLLEHDLSMTFTDQETAEATALANGLDITSLDYIDATDIPFVTIDSKSTLDMDDALFAQQTDHGWHLKVAIADASAYLPDSSILDERAKKQLTSCYLPGVTLPMVPTVLSNDAMSLKEGEIKPALVFSMDIAKSGEPSNLAITPSLVKNHAKLAYDDVSQWVDTNSTPDEYAFMNELNDCTLALGNWRQTHANPMVNRPDYRIRVDDNLVVTDIVKESRNSARSMVEEAMIATNYLTALWFENSPGLFMSHAGFKGDRHTELKGLLRDFCPSVADEDATTLEGFKRIIQQAHQIEDFPLATLLTKRFERGVWQRTSKPHYGLGLRAYSTVTSPIRKYSDLVMHRLIKQKLKGEEGDVSEELVQHFNENGYIARNISNSIEKRLGQQWLEQQPEQTWQVQVNHLTANGLILQIKDSGIMGFLDLKRSDEKFSYDPLRMMLKSENRSYKLNDELSVKVTKIDEQGIVFTLVE